MLILRGDTSCTMIGTAGRCWPLLISESGTRDSTSTRAERRRSLPVETVPGHGTGQLAKCFGRELHLLVID